MSMEHEPLRYAHTEGHTDVCYSEDGQSFLTVGADGDLRIWSTKEGEDPLHNCIGEWALSVRQKGNSVYVATSNNDIQILSLPNGDRDGVLDRFVAPINHIAIGKNSNVVALAGEDMEVKLLDLEKPGRDVKIFNNISGPCLSVALSPNCQMLAASAGDCKLRVWNVESCELLKELDCFPKINSFQNAKLLCRIDFEPVAGKLLAYPEENNVVLLNTSDWSQIASLTCGEVSSSYSIVQFSPCGKFLAAASEEGDFVIWEVATENVFDHSRHIKSSSICGMQWNPLSNGQIVYTDVEGQLSIISNCINQTKNVETELVDGAGGEVEDAVDFGDVQFEDDDDENALSLDKIKQQYLGDVEPELDKVSSVSSRSKSPRPRTPETPLQQTFMPSSTPEHLDPRYLCWNDVGVIRCYGNAAADEAASKSIEVEFHDGTFHNSMMMPNYLDYTMASLSKGALIVANQSQIKVVPLSASSKEWVLKLEEPEVVVAVAASKNLVCFATSNYLIRVCTIFGTQRAVFSSPGPLLCMAAFKECLLLAYHSAGVRASDQCIGMKLVKFTGTTLKSQNLDSALGPDSTLYWLGFSDIGTPAMMDSQGMLSLFPHSCNIWVPFCNTSKHGSSPSDMFFVTSISEAYQAVAGIKCRGTVYPSFTPRPVICELPLDPPFAEQSTEKTQLEQNLFAWSNLQVSSMEKKFKETALKTFALACKNDLDERALEFMEILSNPQIVTLGLKYASKLEKRRLVDKLLDLAKQITNIESNGADENVYSVLEVTNSKPVHRRLTLSSSSSSKSKLQTTKESPTVTQESTENFLTATSVISNDTICEDEINTQESLFTEEMPTNPFLKNLQQPKVNKALNPLSLVDRFAGVNYEKENNRGKNRETIAEKRKQPESAAVEKQKQKQRKLSQFSFSKRD